MIERFQPPEDLESSEAPENQTEKKIRGRPFPPGNPGRPVGAKNKTTRLLEQLMADEAPNLIRKVIDRAKGGTRNVLHCVSTVYCPGATADRSTLPCRLSPTHTTSSQPWLRSPPA